MKNFISLILLSLCILSCSNDNKTIIAQHNTIDSLRNQNKQLENQVETLTEELNQYKYSPEKLCSNIDELFKQGNKSALSDIYNKLQKYHPESEQFRKVALYIKTIDENERKQRETEKTERLQAVNKLKKKYDDITGRTWYSNPYFTHYNNTNLASIYIGTEKGKKPWLRLEMSYYGEDWIFFEKAYLSYDGNTKEIYFNEYRDKKTENSGGHVWEWVDVSADDSMIRFLNEMVKGKDVKMRLSGKYTKTRNLTTKEINGIKDVLLAYDVLINEK